MQTSLDALPQWIRDEHATVTGKLTKRGNAHFELFLRKYADITRHYSQLPPETEIFEIYKISQEHLSKIFRTPNEAIAHACEGLIGRWLFQHAHKFNAALDGFRYSLDNANFLLALSCARSLFEETIHFHLFLSRIETAYQKANNVLIRELSRLKKGKPLTAQTQKAFLETHFDLIKILVKSLEGSDYDWNEWHNRLAKDAGLDLSEILIKHETSRKTHINDCIEALRKREGMAVKEIYDFLSEMVHPNFGSNTLVVSTRVRLNDITGNLLLASRPKNAEAASWFFETSALPIAETFSIDLDCTRRANSMFELYMNWSTSFNQSKSSLPVLH